MPPGRVRERRPGPARRPVAGVTAAVGVRARGVAGGGLASSGGLAYTYIGEIQRARLLAAAVGTIDDLGYAETSVANIVTRSRVSRRTFYKTFANREECLAAVLDDALTRVALDLRAAGLEGLAWRERLRLGLWTILSFLDRDAALARVCVVQALGGGSATLVRRERVLASLAKLVDEGRRESSRGGECTRLTAEGLVGAAYMIVYGRLVRNASEPLTDLLGELMGMIVLPYLGPAAARREQARQAPAAVAARAASQPESATQVGEDPLQGVPMRLTYRTARVLEGVQEHPGASNRRVADHAGIADPGQVSKLLRRLEQLELLENRGGGHAQGEPNAWSLTNKGALVAQSIRIHASAGRGSIKDSQNPEEGR